MARKSCVDCVHQEICVFYRGEVTRGNFWHKDFIKELKKLQKELGQSCPDYLLKQEKE